MKQGTEEFNLVRANLNAINTASKDLSSHRDCANIYKSIVDNAMKITGFETGSLIVFDERSETCRLADVQGYKAKFTGEYEWELQPGGTIENLLDCGTPLFINNLANVDNFDNPVMGEETVSILATPLKEQDCVIGFLFIGSYSERNITENELLLFSIFSNQASLALQKALLLESNKELAVIDALTGLYNPRHFFETLEVEVKRVQRYGGNFSVIALDVDNLGYINNAFGHNKGDWVVKKIADLITSCARQTDYKARFGGDEFALILPSTTYQQASVLANRIRRQVNEILVDNSTDQMRLSVSIGIAEFPSLGPDSTSLLTAVNTALTVCKQRGRNLVCCYEENADYTTI
jgi:diguanylate cyclase (GGDEF)-like protein